MRGPLGGLRQMQAVPGVTLLRLQNRSAGISPEGEIEAQGVDGEQEEEQVYL